MRKRRVVISGIGAVSPYGWSLDLLLEGLRSRSCALSLLRPDESISGMQAKLCGRAPEFDEKSIPREYRRAMSRMAIMGFVAASEALAQAGIEPSLPLAEPFRELGVYVSSTLPSTNVLEHFFGQYLGPSGVDTVRSTVFFKAMGHGAASSLCVAFGLSGRCLAPAAACASSLQAIGLAYESIAFGRAEMLLAGGVEEFHPLLPATFDKIGAASHCPEPENASRPFDTGRDGIVCGEGAGLMLLESYESALSRGAPVLAEITGFASNTSPGSIAFPDNNAIENCMRAAMADAGLTAGGVDMLSAHATATEAGDIAEGRAIERIFKAAVPVNSLKGYMGHTMAASGALELAAAICAARSGFMHGTRNLDEPDPRCGNIRLRAEHQEFKVRTILKNSFGLGGVNASLLVALP